MYLLVGCLKYQTELKKSYQKIILWLVGSKIQCQTVKFPWSTSAYWNAKNSHSSVCCIDMIHPLNENTSLIRTRWFTSSRRMSLSLSCTLWNETGGQFFISRASGEVLFFQRRCLCHSLKGEVSRDSSFKNPSSWAYDAMSAILKFKWHHFCTRLSQSRVRVCQYPV